MTQSLQITNTSDTIKFLRHALSKYMETNRLGGRKWSNLRLANYISRHEKIDCTIDDTTIGRFLNEKHPQQPSDATLQTIADFLLIMRAITHRQLELATESVSLQSANIQNEFFGRPDTNAFQEFIRELSGKFYAVGVHGHYLLTSVTCIDMVLKANVLNVNEELKLHRFKDLSTLRVETGNFAPKFSQAIHHALVHAGTDCATNIKLSGFALTNPSFHAWIQRPRDRGFHSILAATGMVFDDEGQITGIKGNRNNGWRETNWTENAIDEPYEHEIDPIKITKFLCTQLDYHKSVSYMENLGFSKDAMDDLFYGSDTKFGYRRLEVEKYTNVVENLSNIVKNDTIIDVKEDNTTKEDNNLSPDEKLTKSLHLSDLNLFKEALAEGADANFVPEGEFWLTKNPMLFGLASNGMLHWVQPLIETGRCDLSIRNEQGLPASHSPGVSAIEAGPTSNFPSDEQFRRYQKISDLIDAEEIRQIQVKKGWIKPGPM